MKFYKTLLAVLLLLGLSIFVGCDNSTESSNPTAAAAEQSSDSSSDDDNSSSSDSSSASCSDDSSDSSSDIIIMPTVYTVRFNPNGGTGMMVDLTADKGDSITLSANTFVKTGYTFTHWNDAVDGSGTVYADKAAISDASADIVLFAQWKPNHYVITLSNDGDVKGDLTLDAVYDSVLPNLSALPSKKGYDFRGYFTESDGHGKKFIDKEGKAAAEKWTVDDDNPILYAFFIEHESHTIEYRNTKNALNPNQTAFKEADSVVLSDIAVVGYTFIGWFDASTDGSLITGWNAGDKDDNVTLWARWAPNIICFSDGTFGSAVAAGKTPVGIAIVTDSDGIPLKIMNLKQSDKSLVWAKYGSDGYYGKEFNTSLDDGFDNWAVICKDVTDEDDPGSYPAFEYASSLGGGWYMPAKNELNAIYQCKDEINTALRLLKDAGFDADLIDDVDGNRSWYQSSSADGKNYRWVQLFSDGEQRATLRVDGYVRTVRYFHSYKVIFDPNGGTGDMADLTVDIVEPAVLPDCEFTREYHSFVGWNDRADGTGNAYTAGQTVSGIGADGEAVTLYAQWRHHTYTVVFDANDGTSTMTDQAICVDETADLMACPFTRKYYTFIGWNDKADGSGNIYADGQSVSGIGADGETVTLYAQWRHHTYTVYFHNNGESGWMDPQTYYVDEIANLPACTFFSWNDYISFNGWNDKADGTGKAYTDEEQISELGNDGTKVWLYAQWKTNHYVITLSNDGDVSGDLTLDAVYNSKLPDLTVMPSKEGYYFDGYFSKPNGEGIQYIDDYGHATEIWKDELPDSFPFVAERYMTLYASFRLSAEVCKTVYYEDGTYSTDIIADKTPVGVVIETTEFGKPLKILYVKEDNVVPWCDRNSTVADEERSANTTDHDGSVNWGILSDMLTRGIEEHQIGGGWYYPHNYANNMTELGGGWYLPAINELDQIYTLKSQINETLETLVAAGHDAILIKDAKYWSSSFNWPPLPSNETDGWYIKAQDFSTGARIALHPSQESAIGRPMRKL
ncbi:MAG: InlB B-repeat-containing protein [Spirochaetales bacterium]|nr:InlB B-repeat-containing protein [Spirochaetales bacterium]